MMKKNKSKYFNFGDRELIGIIKGSDKKSSDEAFMEIYDRYALKVNAYCRSILNDRELAEDILQETFIKFYQNVKPDFKEGTVIGYLIRISRNLCLNYKRDNKQTVSIDDFEFPVYDKNTYEEKELNDLLMISLDLLDSETKDVLVMRVFNDLPYEEIAEIMNITETRARYIVFKAKSKLKNILMPYFRDVPNNNIEP